MYTAEFILLATAHLIAVSSPGPDFAIIVRQSVAYNKSIARWSALGLGIGIILHCTYSLLGIGLLFSTYEWLYDIVKYLGAVYLAYLGVLSIRSNSIDQHQFDGEHQQSLPTVFSAIKTGFLTNALNPKATLFILFLYTSIVNQDTPMWIKSGYGVYMGIATTLWFSLIAQIFGTKKVKAFFLQFGHWFDRVLGIILIGLAIKVVFF